MNKLREIALLLLICVTGIVHGQEVIYSPYEKFDLRGGDFAVVGKAGSRLYTYRASTDGFFLDAYNDSMERLATVVLDFFPKKIYETRFIAYPNQILVLYQAIESNKVIQYAALLDDMGRLKKGPLQLAEAKTGFLGPNKNYFSSAVSEDKKNIIVYSAATKGANMDFDGKWIDDQLNITHRGHATYKTDNDLEHGEAIAGNDGNLYMPLYTPVGSKGFADQLWLLTLQQNATRFIAKELPLNSLYAATAFMKLDNANNRIYVGGFYSDKKNGNYEGVLYAYYDIATNAFQNRKMIKFDTQILTATGEKNKKRAFNEFQVKQLIVKNDGGFVLVAEDFYVTTRSSYAPGFGYYSSYYPSMSSNIREYHYNDILSLSYNSEGVREWFAFVRKDQYSQEDGGLFSSYAFLNTGGTLGFLYNDFDMRRSSIQLATVDATGKVAMHSFSSEGNSNPDWLPRSGKQISGREIVIPCLRKRQICFAKVVF